MDKGLVPLANSNNESWCQGLDGLAQRTAEYYKQVRSWQQHGRLHSVRGCERHQCSACWLGGLPASSRAVCVGIAQCVVVCW